eukprot:GHVU01234079.1.p1 GENE.GHVU01234079.1~~GHVU01234079.1.p1  ORF type:complete len:285 (+),score=28.56 GHVU01234079.1:592-1446(+)
MTKTCRYKSRREEESNCYVVEKRLVDSEGANVVRLSPKVECSCNLTVSLGVPCAHIVCVLTAVHGKYVHNDELFNNRWYREQPSCVFANRSPFTSADESSGESSRSASSDSSSNRSSSSSSSAVTVEASCSDLARNRQNGEATTDASQTQLVFVHPIEAGIASHPSDHQQDVRHYVSGITGRIGFDSQMLTAFQTHVKAFEQLYLHGGGDGDGGGEGVRMSLQEGRKRSGKPKVKRVTGKHRNPSRCTACSREGHTRVRCPMVLEKRKREQVRALCPWSSLVSM